LWRRLTRSTVPQRTNRRLDNAIYLGFADGAPFDQRRFYRSDGGLLRRLRLAKAAPVSAASEF